MPPPWFAAPLLAPSGRIRLMRRGRTSLCMGEFARNAPTGAPWRQPRRHDWLRHAGRRRGRGRMSPRRRPRRHANRDGLWPRGGRDIDAAVAGIFAAKGRPAFNPLIAHVLDVAAAREHARIRRDAERLARSVLAGAANLGSAGCAGPRQSARARRPRHSRGSRARPSGRARADRGGGHSARGTFGQPFGPGQPDNGRSCPRRPRRAGSTGSSTAARRATGSNSTIVACLGGEPALLRPGAIPAEAIEAVLGESARLAEPPGAMAERAWPARHRTTRRARMCGSRRRRSRAGKPCSISPGLLGKAVAGPARSLALGRSYGGGGELFAHLRALDASGAAPSRPLPSLIMDSAARSTTGFDGLPPQSRHDWRRCSARDWQNERLAIARQSEKGGDCNRSRRP